MLPLINRAIDLDTACVKRGTQHKPGVIRLEAVDRDLPSSSQPETGVR